MPRCAIIPYEGREPYIFVSYAHRDSNLVYPILEELDLRGYRIWYDDGIAPGSEWPENIAQHLSACALTLAFISPNSIASDNCRREITFALSKRKPFLAIILQPTEMSLGMEMQLSAQQCVMKYSYDTDEAFYRKLCSCPELTMCQRPEPPTPQQPIVAAAPQQPVATPAAHLFTAPASVQPAPLPAAPSAPAAAPAKAKKELKPKKQKQPLSPQKKRLMLILSAAVAAAVLLVCLLPTLLKVKVTDDKKVSRGETYLSLSGVTVTEDTIKQLNKLNKLQSLTFNNCSFESGVLSGFEPPEEFRNLYMYNCSGVDDLTFLEDCQALSALTLENSGISDSTMPELSIQHLNSVNINGNADFTDLSKFSACTSLSTLNISGTGVSSLEGLPTERISSIDFSDTAVADISLLADIDNLVSVVGSSSNVTDLDPLAGLDGLTTLDFSGCSISSIDGSFLSLRLNTLRLADNQLTDISAFANCTVLRKVDISGNSISDVSLLEKSSATLQTLDLSHNPLKASQLLFIEKCSELTELYIDGISTYDLRFLTGCSQLTKFTAIGCEIGNISAISGCTQLSLLRLADNDIYDITPLAELKSDSYVIFDLSFNPFSDASSLPSLKYSTLGLLCEDLDPTTIPDSIKGTTVALYYDDALLSSPIVDRIFSYVTVYGCPADKRVALEDEVGSYSLRFIDSMEDLAKQMADDKLDYSFIFEPEE